MLNHRVVTMQMEEGGMQERGRSKSRPSSPLSPRTRRVTDASLKRLRSGTTLLDSRAFLPHAQMVAAADCEYKNMKTDVAE